MSKIVAPFSPEQIRALNAWQTNNAVHPFTCGQCGGVLVATEVGWSCPNDSYQQNWAHDFMAEPRGVAVGIGHILAEALQDKPATCPACGADHTHWRVMDYDETGRDGKVLCECGQFIRNYEAG